MARLAAVIICAILLTGCAYRAAYMLALDGVQSPGAVPPRSGVEFEDDFVRIVWTPSVRELGFVLTNKSDETIRIPWEDAAYIDPAGTSHRVLHAGVRYLQRDQAQPPTVVPRGSSIDDLVFPSDFIYYTGGSRYTSGGWRRNSLFLDEAYSRGELIRAINAAKGKQFQVFLPVRVGEELREYTFRFRVEDGRVVGP